MVNKLAVDLYLIFGNTFNSVVFDISCELEIEHVHSLLRSNLECQYGLLDELVTREVLTAEQVVGITEPQHNAIEQNNKLLSLMSQKPQANNLEAFVQALGATYQGHLISLASYYITKDQSAVDIQS
jgi:hypothetical protein